MTNYQQLQKRVVDFREARGWERFHTHKSKVVGLFVEAGELAEHFMYREGNELSRHLRFKRRAIADELCDVLFWIMLMSHDFKVDIGKVFLAKMAKNIGEHKAKGFSKLNLELPTQVHRFEEMIELIIRFRELRGWGQQIDPRDILLKLVEEIGELARHVQWKNSKELTRYVNRRFGEMTDELADVLICVLLLFHYLEYDIEKEFSRKMAKNAKKHPIPLPLNLV